MLTLFLFLQVNLCEGRALSKTKAFPMHPYVYDAETFARITGKPPVGKWVVDPVFFTRYMRITDSDPLAHHSDGEKRGFTTTLYSSMPDWSSDEKYQILYSGVNAHELWEGQPTFHKIRNLPIAPNDIEHVYWSPRPGKEHVFYYPSSFSGERKLYEVQVSDATDVKAMLHDFKLPPTNCSATSARGLRFSTMYMSYDEQEIVGMSCGDTCWLYSIGQDKVLGTPNTQCNTSQPSMNAPFPAPSGTRAYVATGQYRGISFDIANVVPLANVDAGIKEEHRSIGKAASGADIYNAVQFEAQRGKPSATLISTDILTGAWRVLIGQSTGWPGPFSTVHESMVSLQNPGWIYSSQVGAPDYDSPTPQGMNVLYAANYDTRQVCQLLHLRTMAGTRPENKWGYWGEPHPNGSPTGKYVAWDSDWVNGDSVNVYILDNTWHITDAQIKRMSEQ